MYTTYWGSQEQFIYSSGVDDAKGQHEQEGKHSQTGARVSHVEVRRYEETINHYTTTSGDAAPLPRPIPAAFNSYHGMEVNPLPVSPNDAMSRKYGTPEEKEEEMEDIVRSPSPSTSLELLDSKTRWLFVHCTFHPLYRHDIPCREPRWLEVD